MAEQANRHFPTVGAVEFPFRVGWDGRAARATHEDHVRHLVEQVLFTAPGERVNRPSLGSGLHQLVFSPNSALLAETTRVTAEAALQQWLGHLIEVTALQVTAEDNVLRIDISYLLRRTRERTTAHFERAF